MRRTRSLHLPMRTSGEDWICALKIYRDGLRGIVRVSRLEKFGSTRLVSMEISEDGRITILLSSELQPANLAALKFQESVNAKLA